jgi:hypothetical protein
MPLLSLAQAYTPLINIPGVNNPQDNFSDFINALYALAIGIAGLLAVVKLIIAGMRYMLSDVVTSKTDAIKDIYGAVFGLLIVLSAYLILYVINPDLTTTNVFKDLKNNPVKAPVSTPVVVGAGVPVFQPNPVSTVITKKPEIKPCLISVDLDTGVESYNCTERENDCKAETPPGRPSTNRPFRGANTVTCLYGEQQDYACLRLIDDDSDEVQWDCQDTRRVCTASTGTPYDITHSSGSVREIMCIRPF